MERSYHAFSMHGEAGILPPELLHFFLPPFSLSTLFPPLPFPSLLPFLLSSHPSPSLPFPVLGSAGNLTQGPLSKPGKSSETKLYLSLQLTSWPVLLLKFSPKDIRVQAKTEYYSFVLSFSQNLTQIIRFSLL